MNVGGFARQAEDLGELVELDLGLARIGPEDVAVSADEPGGFVQLRQQSGKPIRNPLLYDIVVRDAQLIADLGLDIAVEGSQRAAALVALVQDISDAGRL